MGSIDGELFTRAFITLLVILDPVAGVPLFLTLTRGYTNAQRRRAATQAALTATGVILAFALFGQVILRVLDISLAGLQVAGGLLLGLVALDLLRPHEGAEEAAFAGGNVAFVPLGTPLLAGPGAIAATMLYAREAGSPVGAVVVGTALLLALGMVWLVLRYAEVIERVVHAQGIKVLSQIMGLLTTAIAVELVASGVRELAQGSGS